LGVTVGLMIGMEIPLIARIREVIHQRRLTHNAGTMYGADYIGAGAGAAVFVLVMLKQPVMVAACVTAGVNLIAAMVFMAAYRRQLQEEAGRPLRKEVLSLLLLLGGIIYLFHTGMETE